MALELRVFPENSTSARNFTLASTMYYRPIAVDCVMSEWSNFSACSVTCGDGTQTRTRSILSLPRNLGRPCNSTVETRVCPDIPPCLLSLEFDFDGDTLGSGPIDSLGNGAGEFMTSNISWAPTSGGDLILDPEADTGVKVNNFSSHDMVSERTALGVPLCVVR